MPEAAVRTFEVRHLQLARAFFAAVAAIMITFSADHSAAVGLAVFSGWAIATALVLFAAAWLVYPAGRKGLPVLLGVLTLAAGMIGGLPPLRTTIVFFVVLIIWSIATGLVELIAGIRQRRRGDADGRDGILAGAVTLLLGAGLLAVNPAFRLDYLIAEIGRSFTLTGITIGVGLFGAYAAIIAVLLGIAGFSPRRVETPAQTAGETA